MPTRRNKTYYVKRTFPGMGGVYRSLGTRSKERAKELENMLARLHDGGRIDVVRAFKNGDLPIQTMADFYESGRTHELVENLTRPESVRLDTACKAALRDKSPDIRPSTHDRYRQGLAHLRRFAGEATPVDQVLATERMKEFKASRIAEGARRETVNNDLVAASVLVTYAMRKGWIKERPEIKQFKSQTRIRYLEPDQLTAYMAVLRRPFRAQMQLLVFTGMRLGESEGLRACDFQFTPTENRCLIQDSKTETGVRPIFVPQWVAEAVRSHADESVVSGRDLIFTIPRRTVQAEPSRACNLAGIFDYTIHDHKHTAAVALARAGIPLNLLQRQLGHKHIAMTMRYAQFHPDYSDTSIYFDRVGAKFGLLTPGNSSGNTPVAPLGADGPSRL